MLSHSQNFEDVMLYRALRHVEKGMWIDVGAWHPQLDSVTKWFYDCGWSGINLEPNLRFFRLLQKQRPRDVNLSLAVGREKGTAKFFQIGSTGMSSLNEDSVARSRSLGFSSSQVRQVEVITIAELFAHYVKERDVHFLKIDVEGFEADVVASIDFEKNRPWIILVEAIEPIDNTPAWKNWEPAILSGGYEFVWFDGINRFYLRQESIDLRKHFEVPVNIFDKVAIPYVRNHFSAFSMKLRELFSQG